MAWVYVSIGTNRAREHHVAAGLDELAERYAPLTVSPVYESEAVGFSGDPFYNLVVGFEAPEEVAALVAALRAIEDRHGRQRSGPKFSARTLDLDLLTYAQRAGTYDGVALPRAEITENAFVLKPLADIAPDERHPELGRTYTELWQSYDQSAQRLWRVPFTWAGREL